MKWMKAPLKMVGPAPTFDGVEINFSQMPSEADVDELAVVATLERVDAFWRQR